MKIRLKDVPDLGSTYHLTRKTAELNESLKDLIGSSPYEAHLFIRPLNEQNFEIKGSIKTNNIEMCSRCGDKFIFDIKESFQELLLPGIELPRDGFYAKPNHISDFNNEGPSVVEYRGDIFDFGEYIHEVVGLAIPFNPAPPEDEKGNCSQCHIDLRGKTFGYDEGVVKPESPFSILKKVKIDSVN